MMFLLYDKDEIIKKTTITVENTLELLYIRIRADDEIPKEKRR